MTDNACPQLARSDNLQLLSTSLRVISNIFSTMRPHLKLQQELFLSFLLDRLVLPIASAAPGSRKGEVEALLDAATWDARPVDPNDPRDGSREREREVQKGRDSGTEARELMLEVVGTFARGRFEMVDLWVNYDCNIEGEDMFERLIKFLCRVSRLPSF